MREGQSQGMGNMHQESAEMVLRIHTKTGRQTDRQTDRYIHHNTLLPNQDRVVNILHLEKSQQTHDFIILETFNGLFSRTTWVRRHQEGKAILNFNEARDDGVWYAVASAGPYANNLHLAPDR